MIDDIARQASQTERKFYAQYKERPDTSQNETGHDEQFSEFACGIQVRRQRASFYLKREVSQRPKGSRPRKQITVDNYINAYIVDT